MTSQIPSLKNNRPTGLLFAGGEDTIHKLLLSITIAAFVLLSTAYSFYVPVFESQDEEHHLDYIRRHE